MEDALIYTEKKGHIDTPTSYTYLRSSAEFVSLEDVKKDGGGGGFGFCGWLGRRFFGWVCDVFLPQGYPHSVSPDYFNYQVWDSMQAYSSGITKALSIQATLVGLGVGEQSATSLAATLTWLLQDGSGMIASIAFAYWKGIQLDCNLKQWRLFADLANNTSFFLRLLAPSLPIPFLPILCVSGILTSLVIVAGDATRAALAVHQARCNNMADVSAKDASQETTVRLGSLLTNLALLPYFTYNTFTTWLTFCTCVFVHMCTNWKAMRALVFNTLNRPRLLYILDTWIENSNNGRHNCLPSPETTNKHEPLILGPAFITDYFPDGFRVRVGCSLNWALKTCTSKKQLALYKTAMDTFKDDNYLLCCNLKKRQIHIIYRPDITFEQELEAFITAFLTVKNYCYITTTNKKKKKEGQPLPRKLMTTTTTTTTPSSAAADYDIIREVKSIVKRELPGFVHSLMEQDWRNEKLQIGDKLWRLI